jgi:CheY-like chemotaxis protein
VPQVLLIDDNHTQLCIRETVLREAGVSVACAGTTRGGTRPSRLAPGPMVRRSMTGFK